MEECVIELQTQILPNSCMSACLAMILSIPQQDIIGSFHEKYIAAKMEPRSVLQAAGMPFRRMYADERKMLPGHTYLLSVPSLNIKDGWHCIIAQCVGEQGCYIVDPNDGRPKKSHSNTTGLSEEVPLGAWSPIYEFKTSDLVEYYGDE